MLYAVSMHRAEDLFDICDAHDLPIRYDNTYELADMIREQAAAACGITVIDRAKIHIDEVTMLREAIERAMIDNEGDVIIPAGN